MPARSSSALPADVADASGATRSQQHRRLWLVLFALVVGLVVVAVAWVVVTGLIARSRLEAARSEIHDLRSAVAAGDFDRARALSADVDVKTASAHQLTSGPAWWVSSNIPLVGTPLRTTRVIAQQAHRVGSTTLPGAVNLVRELSRTPRSVTSIDLTPFAKAAPVLDSTARSVHAARKAISATEPSWLTPVSHGRASIVAELSQLESQLDDADRAVTAALPMLGRDRPQRYFLAFMNEAESRGLGGIPGAFAIVTADDGRVRFTHFGSDDSLFRVRARVPLSAEYRRLYGQDDPAGIFANSDLSPNFPDAARIWAGMWAAKSGQHVDGAIAIDPSAIGYLLRATGAAKLADGTTVSANNVVALTQQKQYTLYGGTTPRDTAARKRYLVTIASTVAAQVIDAPSIKDLAGAARRAVAERRLMLWTSNTAAEAVVGRFGLGGLLAAGTRPFSGFVTNNAAGNKMDFYQSTAMTYRRTGCAGGNTATATLRLTNDTPDYRLPPYVTTVIGGAPKTAAPGYNRTIVTYYSTPGSAVRSVRIDGHQTIVASSPERGLTSIRLLIDIPAGATRTLQVTTAEPAATAAVLILRQPAVHPVTVSVDEPNCG